MTRLDATMPARAKEMTRALDIGIVTVDLKPVAITAGCQFALRAVVDGELQGQRTCILSTDLGLDPEELQASASSVRLVQEENLSVCPGCPNGRQVHLPRSGKNG